MRGRKHRSAVKAMSRDEALEPIGSVGIQRIQRLVE
jgi:hypothetical protein